MPSNGVSTSTGIQQLQILRYSPLQKFSWHWDCYTSEAPVRKLTAVVNLSAPTEYLGGGLQVKADIDNVRFIREQGAGAGSRPTSNTERVRLSGVHAGCWWLG
jgi:hypothetical protein